jgi:hypothetical protein
MSKHAVSKHVFRVLCHTCCCCCCWGVTRSASGTNTGPIREQPPTGKAVAFQGVSRLVFNTEGQIQASYVFR